MLKSTSSHLVGMKVSMSKMRRMQKKYPIANKNKKGQARHTIAIKISLSWVLHILVIQKNPSNSNSKLE